MKTDKWECPSCGREDTEPMYRVCECGTDLERVTCLQPAEGELVDACRNCEYSGCCGDEEKDQCKRWDLVSAQRQHDLKTMVRTTWMFEPCPHSEPLTLTTRRECDECMNELLKSKEHIRENL